MALAVGLTELVTVAVAVTETVGAAEAVGVAAAEAVGVVGGSTVYFRRPCNGVAVGVGVFVLRLKLLDFTESLTSAVLALLLVWEISIVKDCTAGRLVALGEVDGVIVATGVGDVITVAVGVVVAIGVGEVTTVAVGVWAPTKTEPTVRASTTIKAKILNLVESRNMLIPPW